MKYSGELGFNAKRRRCSGKPVLIHLATVLWSTPICAAMSIKVLPVIFQFYRRAKGALQIINQRRPVPAGKVRRTHEVAPVARDYAWSADCKRFYALSAAEVIH